MTIKEACIKVLTESGGRAPLKILCMKVQELVVFKGATPYNSICTELLTHPKDFRRTEGKKGWWELTSFQEEMAELKQQVAELTEINKQIMAIPKEADFIEKFLQEVMNDYKRKREQADPIRNILRHMGHEDAAAVLDAWIDAKEDDLTKALEKLKIQIRNITMTGNDVTYIENDDKDD